MADIGNSTVYIGSPDWYIGDQDTYAAMLDRLYPETAQYGISSVARIEATGAYSPDPIGDPLFFEWELVTAPAKSVAPLRVPEGSVATIEVDIVGVYALSLIVYGANGGGSDEGRSLIIGQPASVAYSGGIEYDVSWVWSVLPDFWSRLSQLDRNKVQVFWQGVQALVASDLVDLFNTKDALSVSSIQASVFKKWLPIDLTLDASAARYFIGPSISNTSVAGDKTVIDVARTSQLLHGKLVTTSNLLVTGDIPQHFDIGRPARITLDQNVFNTRIMGVDSSSPYGTTFIVEPVSVSSSELPKDCGLRLSAPTYQSRVAVLADGKYYTATARGVEKIEIGVAASDVSIPVQLSLLDAQIDGVAAGDTLRFRVIDLATNISVELFSNIAYVDTELIALTMSYDLRTALGLFAEGDDLDEIVDSANSVGWRSRHTGVWITSSDTLQLSPHGIYARNFRVEPIEIYRRTRVRVDDDIKSLFRLTSRVSRAISADGVITLPSGQEVTPIDGVVEAYENLDFYLKSRLDYGYRLRSTELLDVLETAGYDFELAAIPVGAQLTITTSVAVGTYTITEIDGTTIKVTPTPRNSFTDAEFYVSSPVAYIEFTPDVLGGKIIDRLWAEYAVISNSDRIESMYGKPLGLGRDAWERRGLRNTYRDAVAAIIKARVTSSTVESIDNIASLAVGIPVAPYESIIRSIDYEYQLDEHGVPRTFRVMLEEIDSSGSPTGRFTAHDVTAENLGRLTEMSGLAANPTTGKKYVEGDRIAQYASIGEGVRVLDLYSSDSVVVLDDVIDRHRFGVVIDVDSTPSLATSSSELSLVRALISDVKPAHTDFFLRLLKFLVDYIVIESTVYFHLTFKVFDNPYHHRGPANIFDDDIPGMSDRDTPPPLTITTWFPRDGVLTHVVGDDYTLQSDTGGFVDPSTILHFEDTGVYPWISEGDSVELRSHSRVRLDILTVVDDHTLSLRVRVDSPERNLTTLEGAQPFFVYRYLTDLTIDQAVIDQDETLDIDILSPAARNIGVGDQVTLFTDMTAYSGLLRVLDTKIDPVTGFIRIRTFPRKSIMSGAADVRIFREQISDRNVTTTVTWSKAIFIQGKVVALKLDTPPEVLGIQPGDRISVNGVGAYVAGMRGQYVYTSTRLDAPIGESSSEAIFTRTDTATGADDLDEQELAVMSSVRVIRYIPVKFTVDTLGVARIDSQINIRAGDVLYFEDVDVNIGEGYGIIRIGAPLSSGLFVTTLYPVPPLEGTVLASLIRQDRLQSEYFIAPNEDMLYASNSWGREHWKYR